MKAVRYLLFVAFLAIIVIVGACENGSKPPADTSSIPDTSFQELFGKSFGGEENGSMFYLSFSSEGEATAFVAGKDYGILSASAYLEKTEDGFSVDGLQFSFSGQTIVYGNVPLHSLSEDEERSYQQAMTLFSSAWKDDTGVKMWLETFKSYLVLPDGTRSGGFKVNIEKSKIVIGTTSVMYRFDGDVLIIKVGSDEFRMKKTNEKGFEPIKIPYVNKGQFDTPNPSEYGYLYIEGIKWSLDGGLNDNAWATYNAADMRLIGSKAGDICITYEDGTQDNVPLVFGYTLWYQKTWSDKQEAAPFKGKGAEPEMAQALQNALHLEGAWEGNEEYNLLIKLRDKKIAQIDLVYAGKKGELKMSGAYLNYGSAQGYDSPFFETHTVDSTDPYPLSVSAELKKIAQRIYTFETDFLNVDPYEFPENRISTDSGSTVVFSGNSLANIATGIYYENSSSFSQRIAHNGFTYTCYENSYNWHVRNGFGTWMPDFAFFYGHFYLQDAASLYLVLGQFGYREDMLRGLSGANGHLLNLARRQLTLKGRTIPGHYTLVLDRPTAWTDAAKGGAWKTLYTEETFGAEYSNIGNQSQDGHGSMMTANYMAWRNTGRDEKWLEENWEAIYNGGEWILWCLENPDISFAKEGVLFAECESAYGTHALFCNMVCWCGLKGYAEMAYYAGKTEVAERWNKCLENFADAITAYFSKDGKWNLDLWGVGRDMSLAFMSSIYGYDTADMPEEWVKLSLNSFDDLYGDCRGYALDNLMVYGQAPLTQTALLNDRMKEATACVEVLTKASYAPRLEHPYYIPEAASYDPERGIYLRSGDEGNSLQGSEGVECYAFIAGVSPLSGKTFKLMPRLPKDWNVDAQDYSIPFTKDATVDFKANYPDGATQSVTVQISDPSDEIETAMYRFGPFDMGVADSDIVCYINGEKVDAKPYVSGDSKWAWAVIDVTP